MKNFNQENLLHMGFLYETWQDKNDMNDKFNTLKFDSYSLIIHPRNYLDGTTEYTAITITYGFFADKENSWMPIEESSELIVGGSSVPLKFDTEIKLQQFIKLIKGEEIETSETEKLLNEYFTKNENRNLAMNGQHPDFKLDGERNYIARWNAYVKFCNDVRQELLQLAKKINKLKGGQNEN